MRNSEGHGEHLILLALGQLWTAAGNSGINVYVLVHCLYRYVGLCMKNSWLSSQRRVLPNEKDVLIVNARLVRRLQVDETDCNCLPNYIEQAG